MRTLRCPRCTGRVLATVDLDAPCSYSWYCLNCGRSYRVVVERGTEVVRLEAIAREAAPSAEPAPLTGAA